jgi:crotonobetainyl-CoA:carnitine CoA-transferase CaiB-like acyl-CoA transferase
MLSMLQPSRYWPEFVGVAGRPELATDDRFDTVDKIMANAGVAAAIVAEIIESRTFAEWLVAFEGMEGQWAAVQDAWEVGHDPSLEANGYIAEVTDADGNARKLIANPVQFDHTPAQLTRAPLFAEHTDDLLRELGYDDEQLIDLKIAGAVT